MQSVDTTEKNVSLGDRELKSSSVLPVWPRPAASAAIFRDERVLLVMRGQAPKAGLWSLPGGKIEPGETARAAAYREVAEETGLKVDIEGIVDVHDVVIRGGAGELAAHYVLAVYFGRSHDGVPVAASDATDARFVGLSDLHALEMTVGAAGLIATAARLAGVVKP